MNVQQTKRTLIGLPPKQSVFIRGGHGLGKSEVVSQVASEMSTILNKPFGFVDLRLATKEVGDLEGLMTHRDSFTVHNNVFMNGIMTKQETIIQDVTLHDTPLWFPRDPNSHGILFLDEMDRSPLDVLNWAFQIVYDYMTNFQPLPIGWRVVTAGNADQDVYNVRAFDPALLDRFLVIDFKPTVPEWLKYAEKIEVHDAIIKYITKLGSTDLDPPEKIESGKRYPSRRSWVKLSNTIKHMAENGDDPLADPDYLILLAGGFVGTSIAVQFSEFVKKDYKVFTAEEILNNFPKLQEEFEKMIATDFTFYSKQIVTHIKKKDIQKLTAKQSDNLFLYVKTIPREVAAGFWSSFRSECAKASGVWYQSSSEISGYIRGILSKEASTK